MREMAQRALFFFRAPMEFDRDAVAKFDPAHLGMVFSEVAQALPGDDVEVTAEEIDALLKGLCQDKGWKMPQVGQPVRIALSGGTQAPGIGEIVSVLGCAETRRRLGFAIKTLC